MIKHFFVYLIGSLVLLLILSFLTLSKLLEVQMVLNTKERKASQIEIFNSMKASVENENDEVLKTKDVEIFDQIRPELGTVFRIQQESGATLSLLLLDYFIFELKKADKNNNRIQEWLLEATRSFIGLPYLHIRKF